MQVRLAVHHIPPVQATNWNTKECSGVECGAQDPDKASEQHVGDSRSMTRWSSSHADTTC